ncbi:hypothetical protein N0V82_003505 [Gnomoniopsis sp. IMI 355080]|nr:hypothetical protein N0V82_003505 [Gnomoniopsis sp. IMI 355080]
MSAPSTEAATQQCGERVREKESETVPSVGSTNHIPATIVQGDTRTDEERAQARAAYDLWLQELRHIRRAKPLLGSTYVTEITVPNARGQSNTAQTNLFIDLTNLDDDDDDDDPVPNLGLPPPITGQAGDNTYRGANGERLRGKLLAYQKRRGRHGNQHPSPGMLCFDMARLRRKVGMRVKTDEEVAKVTSAQLWGTTECSTPKTFEDSLQQNWLKDVSVGVGARLIRGLPMMEDIVFLRAGNYIGTRSNCFWKAVAYQVYGDHSFDVRVKAEHLEYFSRVLRWSQHPKHALYTEMNKTFYAAKVFDHSGVAEDIVANIFQLMTIPSSYTNSIMFEITADLYNLFITMYDIGEFSDGRPSTAKVQNITMNCRVQAANQLMDTEE